MMQALFQQFISMLSWVALFLTKLQLNFEVLLVVGEMKGVQWSGKHTVFSEGVDASDRHRALNIEVAEGPTESKSKVRPKLKKLSRALLEKVGPLEI